MSATSLRLPLQAFSISRIIEFSLSFESRLTYHSRVCAAHENNVCSARMTNVCVCAVTTHLKQPRYFFPSNTVRDIAQYDEQGDKERPSDRIVVNTTVFVVDYAIGVRINVILLSEIKPAYMLLLLEMFFSPPLMD